jgi:NAD(P) transhydrogenase subunit alpha
VGVAGLQAIATAKRLGAVVSAYDVRPAVREQVESLGAKFVDMELETDEAEGTGGYAREMNEDFYRRQREFMAETLKEMDVVITTAAIPGRKSPILVTEEMVKGMPRGAVIVDLAVERGGNCELSRPGQTVQAHGASILGPVNIPASLASNASILYSRNITSFLTNMVAEGQLVLSDEDEIVQATMVTHAGEAPNEQTRERLGL